MQNLYLETQHYGQENPRGSKALTLGTREALGEEMHIEEHGRLGTSRLYQKILFEIRES